MVEPKILELLCIESLVMVADLAGRAQDRTPRVLVGIRRRPNRIDESRIHPVQSDRVSHTRVVVLVHDNGVDSIQDVLEY